jgi:hypothetical protein
MSKYYKGLFGESEQNNFAMDVISNDITKVSKRENEILTAPFKEEEVREAIFQIEYNIFP